MPKKSAHPYVAWRDGRPRFTPSPELRAAGHKGRDLRHDDGAWFTRGEAVDWSDAFVKSLSKAEQTPRPQSPRPKAASPTGRRLSSAAPAGAEPRSGGSVRPKGIEKRAAVYTVAQLFEDWFCSPKFQIPADPDERRRMVAAKVCYAPSTVADFRWKAGVIAQADAELYWSPADALMTPIVFGLYEHLLATRGVATARGAVTVLSIALGWGRRRGKVSFRMNDGANPAHDLDMATPPPRIRVGTRAEIETLVAVADRLGRPDAGDMIMLGLWTGQRQGDRLVLEDRGLDRGRRVFRQSKTGVIVAVREVPALKARLQAAAERRRTARSEALLGAGTPEARDEVGRRFSRVVLNELVDERYGKCFWRPFEGQTYGHLFAEIRAIAVRGIARGETLPVPNGSGSVRSKKRAARLPPVPADVEWEIAPCASLADFHEADLRDTAVTWMARGDRTGGASIPEICAVTGHKMQSATRILRHYLAIEPELGDAAIGKMLAWYDEGGTEEAML